MLATVIYYAFQLYTYAIIGYVLMSWIPALQNSAIGGFLAKIVEPYLNIFKRFIPPIGMIDISPIVALIALQLISTGLFRTLYYLGLFG
ncbi:MAG: YggT family protein [Kurthia sp.]|nr:YggT family protein [Candidatus Kurthia equi]